MTWSKVHSVGGVERADRSDGAFVEVSGFGRKRWHGHGTKHNEYLRALGVGGPVRKFGTAEKAIGAVDEAWPLAKAEG